MKHFISIICSLYLCLSFNNASLAQSFTLSAIKEELDDMFTGLDKTKVPTGYLWDTAVNLVGLEYYNGSVLTDR